MALNETESPRGGASKLSHLVWLGGLTTVLVALLVSVLWFIRDRDFEPALAVIAGVGALGAFLLKEGRRALLFFVGFLGGAAITVLLTRAVLRQPIEAPGAAAVAGQERVSAAQKENGELRRQVAELTKSNESLGAEAADLRNQLQAALQQKGGDVTAPTAAAPPPAGVLRRVEVNDFVLDLKSCRATGGNVEIVLSVQNRGPDRQLRIFSGTNLISASEQRFEVNEVRLGGERKAYALFTNGVPMEARLIFRGVASQVDRIALLDIYATDGRAQFRDLAVSR